MVEINNQRRRSSIMLAWSEGTDNGRQKTRKSWLWRHCGRRLFTDYSDHPHKLVTLNPKLKSTGAGRYQLLSRWWDAASSLAWTSLEKVRTLWHYGKIKGVALYLWLIVVISVRQSTVATISGLHCRALVMVSSSIRLTAWKRAERSEIDVWAESPRLSRSGYLHHRLPVMGC